MMTTNTLIFTSLELRSNTFAGLELRSVTIDGKPWHVAEDTCRLFSQTLINNSDDSVYNHLVKLRDEEEYATSICEVEVNSMGRFTLLSDRAVNALALRVEPPQY